MPGVPDFVAAGPWWGLFAFLWLVVFLRTQATYWIARWARSGADALAGRAVGDDSRRARLARRLSGPGTDRARAFLERWGFFGIPVSFLTIGFQTLVNATAGYTRMRFDLYTLALIPGCVVWSAIYTTVGLSLWEVWTRSPVLLGVVLLAIVAVALVFSRVRRRTPARGDANTPAEQSSN